MGGDHKCPVCQATFTRPQHVARHMRSHTGDRPYKCQHCGDQFARSDLLSRHVNKCHAGEKPLNSSSSGTNRRKGAASATRATTSKQACDQCVTSSLPCDGCNPCAKCVQRKCRCTYVKFHRQTAPIGPGHNPRPSAAAVAPPGIGSQPQVIPTSVNGIPTHHHPHAMPPFQQQMHLAHGHPYASVYGTNDDLFLGPPPDGSASGLYSSQFSFPPLYSQGAGASAHSGDESAHPSDFASKYRAQQAELLRRGSLGSASPHAWHTWSGSESESERPSGSLDKDIQAVIARQLYNQHQHPGGYDPYYSLRDRGSGDDSGSVSGSASSSSVNLSLDGHPGSYREYHLPQRIPQQQQPQHQRNTSSSSPPLNISQTSRPSTSSGVDDYASAPRPGTAGEGGFSSAFGLMSLDDPNVLAGLANDGQPFFSDVMDALEVGDATPMPKVFDNPQGHVNHLQSQGYGLVQRPSTSSGAAGGLVVPPPAQTPGSREQETRELREFWKQYMRTPLTSGGGGSAGGGGDVNMLSPGPSYRRQRVASLPSAKTPTATMEDHSRGGYILPTTTTTTTNGYGYTKSQSNPSTAVQQATGAAAVGNADDLKSYEAAVLARKAPTNLNLVPRVRKKAPPQAAPPTQQVTFAPDTRTSSSSPSESGGGKRRPSFKRLASQTLESDTHKRYRDDPTSDGDGEDGDDEEDVDGEEGSTSPPNLQGGSPPVLQVHAIGRKSDPHNHSTFHHQFGAGGAMFPPHEFALMGGGGGGGVDGGEKKRRGSGGLVGAYAAPM